VSDSYSTLSLLQFCKMFRLNTFLMGLLLLALAAATGCQMAANGQNAQGVRLYQQGQAHAAIQKFQEALANDPNNGDAYYNLAAVYHQLGNSQNNKDMLTQAESLYNQCLDRSPDHNDCYRGLAVLLVETDRPDRAFKLLQNWSMRSPHVADARIELARLYEEFGDSKTARQHLNEAIAVDSNNARAWAVLGQHREKEGQYAQALADYQRSLTLERYQPDVSQRVASIQQATGAVAPSMTGGNYMASPSWPARY